MIYRNFLKSFKSEFFIFLFLKLKLFYS